MREIKQSAQRAAEFRRAVEAVGGRIVSQYWATGQFDGCVIFEAPDEAIAASLLVTLGQQGNVRTRSLRVFDEQEFKAITSNS
jgi:uncharacterized protein with GYD domain